MQQGFHSHAQRQICQQEIGRQQRSFIPPEPPAQLWSKLHDGVGVSWLSALLRLCKLSWQIKAGETPWDWVSLSCSQKQMIKVWLRKEREKKKKLFLLMQWCCYGFFNVKWSLTKNCDTKTHAEFLWCSSSVRQPSRTVSLALNHTNGRRESWIYGRAVGWWYRASCYHPPCLWDNSAHSFLKWWIKCDLLDGIVTKLMIPESLLLWRHSRPAWTRSCAACSGWPCFSRGLDWVTHRGPFQPLPCWDSVIVWYIRGFSHAKSLFHMISNSS